MQEIVKICERFLGFIVMIDLKLFYFFFLYEVVAACVE